MTFSSMVKVKIIYYYLLLSFILILVKYNNQVEGIQVSLRAPRYVTIGMETLLYCDHDVPQEQIHKVEWLRAEQKLFQFVAGRKPAYRKFNFSGAIVSMEESDKSKVSLKNMQLDASGVYTCEVTTNTPIFTKASDEKYITVMQSQTQDLKITFNQANFTVGDTLQVNCTSGPAIPVPHLTWLLNGQKANESIVTSYPEEKSSSSMMELRIKLTQEHVPQMKLTCLSTIPAYIPNRHNIIIMTNNATVNSTNTNSSNNNNNADYADYRSVDIIVEVMQRPMDEALINSKAVTLRMEILTLMLLLLLSMHLNMP